MPANLTPQYKEAEDRFKRASTQGEKLSCLEDMLRTIPKHKGTEKLQADIKRRISKFKKEGGKKGPSRAGPSPYNVEREGAGQVCLFGPPNSGKSTLLSSLTNAHPDVGDYPFTTRFPQAGMMPYEDIQIQLIDTPPMAEGFSEPWQLALIRQADIAILVFDVNDAELLEQTEFVLETLRKAQLQPLQEQGPTFLVLGNKMDLEGAPACFEAWAELFEADFHPLPFSSRAPADLLDLKRRLFPLLGIVRAYTRAPGAKSGGGTPYILKVGATVQDLAAAIHKDISRDFSFAKVWGKARFEGQRVERSYLLEDSDLVEIHTR